MDDFEAFMEERRRKKEQEREEFFQTCLSKVNDGELVYHLLGLGLCERFKLELEWDGSPPNVVWNVVYHFVKNVDIDWVSWLTADNAPMIRPIGDVKRIFPELALVYEDVEDIVVLANKLYGLELRTDRDFVDRAEYIYAYEFDFNSFQPLPIDEIRKLKIEREVLVKYGYGTNEIDKKLSEFGLTDEEMEMI